MRLLGTNRAGFWIRLSLFLLPVIVLLGWLEIGLRHMDSEYTAKATLLRKQENQIDTLYLGASQTAVGINPKLISGYGFNLGNNGQHLEQDIQLLRKYVPRLPNLRTVVFNMQPPIMEAGTEGTKYEWLQYEYRLRYGTDLQSRSDWMDPRAYSSIAINGVRESIGYALHGFRDSAKPSYSFNEQGYMRVKQDGMSLVGVTDWISIGQGTEQEISSVVNEGAPAENRKLLEEEVDQLNERGIRVIFLVTPATPEYARIVEDFYNETSAFMKQMEDQGKVSIVDYMTDSRFTLADFRDLFHLNEAGSVKFSQILNEEVVRLKE